jgi:hypothetical protein
MWMFRGSRAWSQWGVVHRFHVLLACRKFWFSNIPGRVRPLRRVEQLKDLTVVCPRRCLADSRKVGCRYGPF